MTAKLFGTSYFLKNDRVYFFAEKQNKLILNSGRKRSSDDFITKVNIRKMLVECRTTFCEKFHCLKKMSLVFEFTFRDFLFAKGRFCLLKNKKSSTLQ